ncbi:DUF4352 domain-containing protein [Lactococcus garvieae]|uniref:DUF4352 domain-containing protein n=1 Tax=Lactococcus garvieae TaxID=1363 RepID=UPI00254B3D3D|nr:DUF4352 domain-containing protein [Lactococcus garvieae]
MKKTALLSFVITLLSSFTLVGCTSNKPIARLAVNSKSYVLQKNGEGNGGNDNQKETLALEITLENTSNKSINTIFQDDFCLYDKEGNQISVDTDVYDQSGTFKTMSSFALDPNKKKTGYLAFKVDKGEEYKLHYKPAIYDTSNKKVKDSIVEIDTSKIEDGSPEMQKLTASYINQVFMNKSNDTAQLNSKNEETTNLSNSEEKNQTLDINITQAKNDFNKKFSELIIADLQSSGATYEPTSDEIKNIITAVQERNFSQGSVEYSVEELFPKSAIIYIKPKVMNFGSIDMSSTIEKKLSKSDITDTDKRLNTATKILVQELPKEIEKAPVDTPNYMDEEGYKLVLSKTKEDKWIFNSNSFDNYSYSDLESAFMAGE